mmetsp:Transcript_34093/g.86513  ORF Transcript_34093/g.86513 Transcript_34093/m.86513 type:complete len:230 (-) Transcript_34093:97-786(-)
MSRISSIMTGPSCRRACKALRIAHNCVTRSRALCALSLPSMPRALASFKTPVTNTVREVISASKKSKRSVGSAPTPTSPTGADEQTFSFADLVVVATHGGEEAWRSCSARLTSTIRFQSASPARPASSIALRTRSSRPPERFPVSSITVGRVSSIIILMNSSQQTSSAIPGKGGHTELHFPRILFMTLPTCTWILRIAAKMVASASASQLSAVSVNSSSTSGTAAAADE